MPLVGGLLSLRLSLGVLLLGLSGCVRAAVIENDIERARSQQAALLTATDVRLAEAALSTQLVELEALYLRDPARREVAALLDHGYALMAQGFIEQRRLEAIASGDQARAEQERQLQADATERSRYYRGRSEPSAAALDLSGAFFRSADAACKKHDRQAYEQSLSALLAQSPAAPDRRLELALVKRQAAAWLMPNVAERCAFEPPATSAAPPAP